MIWLINIYFINIMNGYKIIYFNWIKKFILIYIELLELFLGELGFKGEIILIVIFNYYYVVSIS